MGGITTVQTTGGVMGLQLPAWLIKVTGNIYLHKFPLWVTYKPAHHKIKGTEVRKILNVVQRGDIMLRRYDGFLNTIFTPGFWGHAGLFVGHDSVIHAVGKGVIEEDILTFCRTDSVSVLRVKSADDGLIDTATACATKHAREKTEYDYRFKAKNGNVYCTELVHECYNKLFQNDFEDVAGNTILTPDGIRKSDKVEMAIEIKH